MQDTTDTGCELDERKPESTLGLHGIDHHDAVGVFDRRPEVRAPSCHADEEYRTATGKLSRQMVKPVWTCGGGGIRIFASRRARKNEQGQYHESLPGGCDPTKR